MLAFICAIGGAVKDMFRFEYLEHKVVKGLSSQLCVLNTHIGRARFHMRQPV